MVINTSLSMYCKKLLPTVSIVNLDSGNLSDQFSNITLITNDCWEDFRRQAANIFATYVFGNFSYEFNFKTTRSPTIISKTLNITFAGDTHVEHIRTIMLAILNCGIDCSKAN